MPPSPPGRPEALRRLSETLLLSSQTLARDPTQLAGQLVGRLAAWDDDALEPLVGEASSWRGDAQLRPVASSLSPPGAALSRLLAGHEGTPRSVAVAPDGLVAASAGNSTPDQTVHVWDVRSAAALHVLFEEAELGGVTPIAFTCDGRLLLTGYRGEIRVFDVSSGLRRPPLSRREPRVTALAAASAAPTCLAAWGDGALTVSDLERGRSRTLGREGEAALALSLSADGACAAVGTVSGLELVDLADGRVIAHRACETGLGGHFSEAPPLALSADRRRVYHGAPPRTWLVDEDVIVQLADMGGLRVIAVSPGGRAVFDRPVAEPGGLVVIGLRPGAPRRELPLHPSSFSAAAITPDGRQAVCADFDHWVTVWSLDARDAPRRAERHAKRVWRLAAADRYAVSASIDGDVMAWTLARGRKVEAEPAARAVAEAERRWAADAELDGELSRVAAAAGAPASRRWARSLDNAVAVGSTWDGNKVSESEEPLDPVGSQLIPVRRRDGSISWLSGHTGPVTSVAVLFDGRLAASGGFGRIVRVWDLERDEHLHAVRGHAGVIWDMAAVPGKPWAVTASEDRTVVLWDLERGAALAAFTGDYAMLRCAVDGEAEHVVAGDVAGSVHVLRIELPWLR